MGIRCRACEGLWSGREGFLQGTVAVRAALGARPFEGKVCILRMFLHVYVCVVFLVSPSQKFKGLSAALTSGSDLCVLLRLEMVNICLRNLPLNII